MGNGFKTQTTKRGDEWGWWLFTHTEKYLNNDKVSRRDSTPDFQEELRNLLSGDALELLLLKTDRYDAEPRAIAELDAVADFGFVYHATTDPQFTVTPRIRHPLDRFSLTFRRKIPP